MKQFFKKNLVWIILIIIVLIVFFIVENLLENHLVRFDESVYNNIMKIQSPFFDTFFKIISILSDWYSLIIICLLSLFLMNKNIFYILGSNLFIIYIFNTLLKTFFKRVRPDISRLVTASGYSFPSGHSMIGMCFYGMIVYLIYFNVKNKYLKWTVMLLFTLLIILIGISRIYLGVHYASDVIAGFCFAAIYLIVLIKILKIRKVNVLFKK